MDTGDMNEQEKHVGDSKAVDVSNKQKAQELVRRNYQLLTQGCGNCWCSNEYCASSPNFKYPNLANNSKALEAVRLVKEGVTLECAQQPVPATSPIPGPSSAASFTREPCRKVTPLTYQLLSETIETCKAENSRSEVVKLIGSTFSDIDVLMVSFPSESVDPGTGLYLDIESVRKAYQELSDLPEEYYLASFINAVCSLSTSIEIELQYHKAGRYTKIKELLNIVVIIMELPWLDNPEFGELAYPSFLSAISKLEVTTQTELVRIWTHFGADFLKRILVSLHQLITIRIVSQSERWDGRHNSINDDEGITAAAKVMKWVYYASLLGGRHDTVKTIHEETTYREHLQKKLLDYIQSVAERPAAKNRTTEHSDPLALALNIRPIDCRDPVIPASEFINETVNDTIEMDQDFTFYKAQANKFSFIRHSFLLTNSTKSMAMYYDNRIRMLQESRAAMINNFIHNQPRNPYLKLRVNRNTIIDDTLIALEMVFMEDPSDLKKQLYVEFDGEQGIDEGGVSKEFFQLLTEEIFKPDYGMFVYHKDTRMFWFNADSFENDGQFTLVGILLGLAIYNHIILDVQFPLVVYRKLMGKLGTLEDMKFSHPVLFSSLRQLLEYDGDVAEDLMTNFVLTRQNMFGDTVTHPLVEGGSEITVTNDNREEFCQLYADYLLNKSIEKQFSAFYKGFHMVIDESPLEMLFSPCDVEELVCGSKDWDIGALQASCDYDGGYDANSDTIKYFWQVVGEMTHEQQRQFLQFTTGSDRVPVGGLSKLKLIITKNGPDSDRLPTSHTCFNVLLLPDYRNYDKLKNRLLLAITHAKGFGML